MSIQDDFDKLKHHLFIGRMLAVIALILAILSIVCFVVGTWPR